MLRHLSAVAVVALSASAVSLQAFAVEPDFRISLNAARFGVLKEEQKPKSGGQKQEETTTTFSTIMSKNGMMSNGGIELAYFPTGYAIYVYPFATEGSSVWLGKALSDTTEVGVTLGLSWMSEDEAKTDDNSTTLGLYAFHALDLGMAKLEFNVNPFFTMVEEKRQVAPQGATPVTVETETEGSSFGLYLDAVPYMSVGKNFDVGAGIDFAWSSGERETKAAGQSSKTEVTASNFGIVLGRLRAKF